MPRCWGLIVTQGKAPDFARNAQRPSVKYRYIIAIYLESFLTCEESIMAERHIPKLVYLHELDSVRNSDAEVVAAQRALYNEIVLNGNTVVLTFNQLADSKAFLSLFMNDDEMLEIVKSLMLNGAIRISRYKDKRTASQYLQDNLKPHPSGSHGKFVLSGWDIPEALSLEERESIRHSIYTALRNSETAYLDQKKVKGSDISDKLDRKNAGQDLDDSGQGGPNPEFTAADYNAAIDRMKRLVDLMLAISNSPFSYIDIKKSPSMSFSEFLSEATSTSVGLASANAKAIARQAISQVSKSDRNNRSAYYRMLENYPPDSADAKEAARLFDVCYNLTTEASVNGVANHYFATDSESIMAEMASRLEDYSEVYERRNHRYSLPKGKTSKEGSTSEASHEHDYKVPGKDLSDKPPTTEAWAHALRIRETVGQKQASGDKLDEAESETCSQESKLPYIYEDSIESNRVIWRKRVISSLLKSILIMVLYAVILSFVEVIISLVQDMMVSWMNLGDESIGDMVSDQGSVASIVVFLAGILIFARYDGNNKKAARNALISFLAVLFVIVLPVLSCFEISVNGGSLVFSTNFASLPDMIAMGLPSLVASFLGVALFAFIGYLIEEKADMPGIIDSAKSAWDSLRDLAMFIREGSYGGIGYVNEDTKRRVAEGRFEDATDLESGISPNHVVDINNVEWNRYVAYVSDDAEADCGTGELKLVTDHNRVLEFERSPEGREIGIMYESPYSTLVVDLVRDSHGREFAYERIIPRADGAVVIVPIYDGRFVLLEQFRHAIRERQICFPRGFGEDGLSAEENARKELCEEIGAEGISGLRKLGSLTPDSGISANVVDVYSCAIDGYDPTMRDEGIIRILELSPEQLRDMIAAGEITDGFTLSAFAMYKASSKIQA